MNSAEMSTHIGRSVTIHGDLTGEEDLLFDGTLEGSVNLASGMLTIGPNAHVKGDLTVRDLVVYGVVEGNVRATNKIELRQSAKLTGDLTASRLSIEESASVKGRVELTGKPPVAGG
jgi:cytoskeletal protein CcmA (bactofilin family)